MTNHTNQTKVNPISWVSTTYFAMGLPFIIISQVLVLIYKDMGISNATIAFWTSWLILPWSLKPLFSLFMETFMTKHFYQITTEFFSAMMLGLIAFAIPIPNFFYISLVLSALMAISGSIHDIAGDGIYLENLTTSQQSSLSGWQGAFYNLAKVICNGALVFLAGYLSKEWGLKTAWLSVILITAVLMGLIGLYHLFMLPKSPRKIDNSESLMDKLNNMLELIVSFFKKKYILLYLLFVFCYRFSEGLATKVAPMFFKDPLSSGGLGLTNEEYGIIYGTFGTIAFIVGSILAGHFVSKLGLKRTLLTLVLSFNIPFIIYALFAVYQPVGHIINLDLFGIHIAVKWVITIGVTFEYLSYGFGFVGLMLFMMQQIAPGKYQMAHYAFANSLMNLSVMVPGLFSGALQQLIGYKLFFFIAVIVSIPSIILAVAMPWAHPENR